MTTSKTPLLPKTITVRGTGHATAKPDCVHILFRLVNRDTDYYCAMKDAAYDLVELKSALTRADISSDDLKTTNFSIETERAYSSKDEKYHFEGYAVHHNFKIVIDFNKERLGKILDAITSSCANPDISIKFTVKDPTSIKNELFHTAAANARSIAEALCKGSGASLGELVSINYSWQEVDFYSHTDYSPGCKDGDAADGAAPPKITPDDIEASDSVTFVWTLN